MSLRLAARDAAYAVRKGDWVDQFPTVRFLFGGRTHRVWNAMVIAMAIFTLAFWGAVALDMATVNFPAPDAAPDGVAGPGPDEFTSVMLSSYFWIALVVLPIVVHTAGRALDWWCRRLSFDDSVLVFIGAGIAFGGAAVYFVSRQIEGVSGFEPALWAFGIPLALATALTRAYLAALMRQPRVVLLASVIALMPGIILGTWAVVGFTSQGAEVLE